MDAVVSVAPVIEQADPTAILAPNYSGVLVDTSPKNYMLGPEQFSLLAMLAKMLGKDIFTYDFETAGLLDDPNFGVTELGMLRISHKDGKVRVNSVYLNPGHPINPKASEVTGITDAMVADKEPYGEKHGTFMNNAAANSLTIIFNGRNFDIPAVYKVHEEAGLPAPRFMDVLDVRDVWVKLSGSSRGKLSVVAESYGVEAIGAHSADADVIMTAGLLNQMIWRHGIDAVLSCRVVDSAVSGADGLTDAPRAISASFLLRQRLVNHFNVEGAQWEGAQALGKALDLSSEQTRDADYELSNLIRDRKVPVDIFRKADVQEFIATHLDAACAGEGLAVLDPTLRLKPVMEFIKKKKGCPKGLDYIQLRCALVSLADAAAASTASQEPAQEAQA
jgi:DNA polymerase III epsilon subunit-like protein